MADLEKIAEDLSALTVIEAAELSTMLEKNGAFLPLHRLQLRLALLAMLAAKQRLRKTHLKSFWLLLVTKRST